MVESVPAATTDVREPLTLATAKTPEERAEAIASIADDLDRRKHLMGNGPIFSTDDLYGLDELADAHI